MKELKFRVWDKGYKVMFKLMFNTAKPMEVALKPKVFDVMQYIGRKDKNGVEIYEGDIVKFNYFEEHTSVVKYSEYYASYEPFNQLKYFAWETVEVIGNVHENPELAKS